MDPAINYVKSRTEQTANCSMPTKTKLETAEQTSQKA
jgi:hypothetical protein